MFLADRAQFWGGPPNPKAQVASPYPLVNSFNFQVNREQHGIVIHRPDGSHYIMELDEDG